jgi:hypothetical protein
MCFSNLPVEFDEQGNPYLAQEAEEIERADATLDETDETLEAAPYEAYEAILDDMPQSVQEQLAGSDLVPDTGHAASSHDSAESD